MTVHVQGPAAGRLLAGQTAAAAATAAAEKVGSCNIMLQSLSLPLVRVLPVVGSKLFFLQDKFQFMAGPTATATKVAGLLGE